MINKGDYVQWEPGGTMFFKEPGYVINISECGKFVFISGSGTGLPLSECRVVNKLYRVMIDYPGKAVPEWHRFETRALADDFIAAKLERRDDYALVFEIDAKSIEKIPLDQAEVSYLDNHHIYRRSKFTVALRDHLNTPPDLMTHFRQLYNG